MWIFMRKEGVFVNDLLGAALRCPLCGEALAVCGNSLVCAGARRHTYDMARAGYVNLNTHLPQSGDTAEMAAAREANCLVKLAGPLVTTADNAAMEFDLSQVDMTKVAALFFTFCAGSSSGSLKLSVNGTELGVACANSWSTSAGLLWLTPFLEGVSYHSTVVSNDGGTGGSKTNTTVKWNEINSITLSGTSNAGATATLFAVKR